VALVPARLALVVVALVAASCVGVRATPETRWQGVLLDARKQGTQVLRDAAARDPTLSDYLARAGEPDFVLVASPTDLEIVYAWASRLVHFHQPEPDAPSVVGELSPLPSGLLAILPQDIRAGTPSPIGGGTTQCWHTTVGTDVCRTCCKTSAACVIACGPQSSTMTPRQKAT
jgi:hypothetical protein